METLLDREALRRRLGELFALEPAADESRVAWWTPARSWLRK
jgi:hypothetical protein